MLVRYSGACPIITDAGSYIPDNGRYGRIQLPPGSKVTLSHGAYVQLIENDPANLADAVYAVKLLGEDSLVMAD